VSVAPSSVVGLSTPGQAALTRLGQKPIVASNYASGQCHQQHNPFQECHHRVCSILGSILGELTALPNADQRQRAANGN